MSEPPVSYADLLNIPVEFEHNGQTYKVRQLTNAEIGEYCTWLEKMAVQKAWLTSGGLPPEGRQAVIDSATLTVGSGCYRVGGKAYLDSLTQPEAGAYQLYLIWRDDHPELTLDDCVAMFLKEYEKRAAEFLKRLGHPNASGDRKGSSGPLKTSSRSSRTKGSRRKKRAK